MHVTHHQYTEGVVLILTWLVCVKVLILTQLRVSTEVLQHLIVVFTHDSVDHFGVNPIHYELWNIAFPDVLHKRVIRKGRLL